MATTRRGRRRRRRGPRYAGPAHAVRRHRTSRATGFPGCHTGACANLTTGKAASLAIEIIPGTGNAITGAVRVGPALRGSGSLTGTVIGNRIWFTSSNPDCPIAWRGVRVGRRILGIYVVAAANAPSPAQFGTWAVTSS